MRCSVIILLITVFCFSCTRDELDGFDQEIQYGQDFEVDAAGDTVYVLMMPNAFTPNGDGVDDMYYTVGWGITGFQMKIYSREGNLVYQTTNMSEGFNGSMQGSGVMSAMQVLNVRIDLTDALGNTHAYDYEVLMYR